MKPRVVIALPLYGHNAPAFGLAFARMLGEAIPQETLAGLVFTTIPYIDQARNQLVRDALAQDPTHILWIDHDVVVPPDVVAKLLARDVPVVGGMYMSKDRPYPPIAFNLDPFEMLQEVPPSEALHLVGGVGMGATLIRSSVYLLMREAFGDEKWYETTISPSIGEDVHFAMRLAEMSIPVFLDPTVQCGHVRDWMVTVQDHLAAKEITT